MTEKLYWQSPLSTSFEITEGGAALGTFEGKPAISLPRTLFYPEGGGQLGDTGVLAFGKGDLEVRIADTRVDEHGTIHHLVDTTTATWSEAFAERLRERLGDVVRGDVDVTRRRDHMVQHTAQHALSRALANVARADTVSARLGAANCTIDVTRPSIDDAELHRAEDLVNSVVMSDVAVETSFPTADELASLDLRKQPNAEKSARGVRIVTIEGFDVTPCGGTHCTRSGQVGQVRIVGAEKYKGMLRLTFQAGHRALADARARSRALAAIAADLTCGALDVPAAVGKLRADLKGTRADLETTRAELVTLLASEARRTLPSEGSGPHLLTMLRPAAEVAELRSLANALTEDPRVVALCTTIDRVTGDVSVVVQRGKDARFDCGVFLSTQTKALGGRGGGRADRAEGRFPQGTSVEALGRTLEEALHAR